MTNSVSPKDAFLLEFHRVTHPAGNGDKRLLRDVEVEIVGTTDFDLPLADDEIYLCDIKARTPRQGDGTRALRDIVTLANQHGVNILLHSAPGDNGPSPFKLREFYRDAGFRRVGENDLMLHRAGDPVSRLPAPSRQV